MNAEDATLRKDGDRYTLTLERHLAHPPEKVWRVTTEQDLLGQWFPCDIEGDWERGAPLRFVFRHGEGDGLPDEDLQGEVLVVEAPRRLEFRWGRDLVKYELTPVGDGCRFRLSATFDDPSCGARDASGWEMCVDNLSLVVNGVTALAFAADVWTGTFSRYVAKFEPVFGPQQDPSGEHPLLMEDADDGPSGPTSKA